MKWHFICPCFHCRFSPLRHSLTCLFEMKSSSFRSAQREQEQITNNSQWWGVGTALTSLWSLMNRKQFRKLWFHSPSWITRLERDTKVADCCLWTCLEELFENQSVITQPRKDELQETQQHFFKTVVLNYKSMQLLWTTTTVCISDDNRIMVTTKACYH